jgi:hypothetical protein
MTKISFRREKTQKRKINLSLKLNETEAEMLKRQLELSGLTVSEYLRFLLTEDYYANNPDKRVQ